MCKLTTQPARASLAGCVLSLPQRLPALTNTPFPRYGNMFFVRDQGESAAVTQALGALTQCLAAPEGCKVRGDRPQHICDL